MKKATTKPQESEYLHWDGTNLEEFQEVFTVHNVHILDNDTKKITSCS